jgi:hypothetical protein
VNQSVRPPDLREQMLTGFLWCLDELIPMLVAGVIGMAAIYIVIRLAA